MKGMDTDESSGCWKSTGSIRVGGRWNGWSGVDGLTRRPNPHELASKAPGS